MSVREPGRASVNSERLQSIFQGCQALLTAVPQSVLAHPPVAEACAAAVLKICEYHAARVLRLPPPHFNALADVLLWGLRQPSVHTANLALRALAELTTQHLDDVAAGQPSLSTRSTAGALPSTRHTSSTNPRALPLPRLHCRPHACCIVTSPHVSAALTLAPATTWPPSDVC